MNGISRTLIPALVLAFVLAGCAHKGKLQGQRVCPNQSNEKGTFHFKSDRGETGGKLWMTLPDGEPFSGKYVQITLTMEQQAVDPFWTGWSPYWNDWGPFGDGWAPGRDYPTFRTNYSNKVVATLFGDKGRHDALPFQSERPALRSPGGWNG